MNTSRPRRTTRLVSTSLSIGLGALTLVACGKKAPPPEPAKDPVAIVPREPTPTPTSTSTSTSSVSAAPTPSAQVLAAVPVLSYKPYEKPKVRHELFPIDNAVLVTDFERVGRVTADSDKIEWIGTLPEGHNDSRFVVEAAGTWPDRVDIGWMFDGRSPSPSYLPLTGTGNAFSIPAGGHMTDPEGMSTAGIDFGGVIGMATVGKTTLLAYQSYALGTAFRTVRGPTLARRSRSLKEAGCVESEIEKLPSGRSPVGVVPRTIGATPKGTLLALGTLCEKHGDALEIWDEKGVSKIVKLPDGFDAKAGRLYGLKDDEAVLFFPGSQAPLRIVNGALEPLAAPPLAFTQVFVTPGPERRLHGVAGEAVYRLDDATWTPIARFGGWPANVSAMASDGKAMWAVRDNRLGKVSFAGEASSTWRDDCATPFVYLYDVAAKNEPTYTFPATRKALAGFAEIGDLSLVETTTDGQRRLGVAVKSKAQGEALIAYLATAMKAETPRLLCVAAKGRVVPLDGAKR